MEVLLTIAAAIIVLGIVITITSYLWPQPEKKPGVQITGAMGPLCQECRSATFHRTDGVVCCETPNCPRQWTPLSHDELNP